MKESFKIPKDPLSAHLSRILTITNVLYNLPYIVFHLPALQWLLRWIRHMLNSAKVCYFSLSNFVSQRHSSKPVNQQCTCREHCCTGVNRIYGILACHCVDNRLDTCIMSRDSGRVSLVQCQCAFNFTFVRYQLYVIRESRSYDKHYSQTAHVCASRYAPKQIRFTNV